MMGVEILLGIAAGAAAGYWLALKRNAGPTQVGTSFHCKTAGVGNLTGVQAGSAWIERFCSSFERFHEWLATEHTQADFWPSFGEVVRSTLHECCDATHVKVYRLAGSGKELTALRDGSPLVQTDVLSARRGIVGHVVTTGRSYIAGDPSHGTLVQQLAQDGESGIVWCFAVKRGAQRLGVITVGQCPPGGNGQSHLLRLGEALIEQFWLMAACAERSKVLEEFDPVCGLLSRPSFLEVAARALREAYEEGAPVAVAVLALEGLRGMNDCGRWEVADELLREISQLLRAKVRSEDVLGRFDGSRFIVLLRRVDSELATLIIRQIIAQLDTLCGDVARWGTGTHVRCGLTGSGTEQPDIRTLVSQALHQSQKAREQNRLIAADVFDGAEITA